MHVAAASKAVFVQHWAEIAELAATPGPRGAGRCGAADDRPRPPRPRRRRGRERRRDPQRDVELHPHEDGRARHDVRGKPARRAANRCRRGRSTDGCREHRHRLQARDHRDRGARRTPPARRRRGCRDHHARPVGPPASRGTRANDPPPRNSPTHGRRLAGRGRADAVAVTHPLAHVAGSTRGSAT